MSKNALGNLATTPSDLKRFAKSCFSFESFVFTRYSSYILKYGETVIEKSVGNFIRFIIMTEFNKSVTI